MQTFPVSSPARRQRGLSTLGMLGVLILVVAAITLTLKLVPHYLDYYTLNSIIGDLPSRDVHAMNRSKLAEMLQKRFKINNLRDFDISDIIAVERSREATVLTLNYERREHLFYNVDVVLTFENRYEY